MNSTNEKGLSKDNQVEIQKAIWIEVEEVVRKKPDNLIVHAGTMDTAKDKNVLTNIKKIVKKVKRRSPQTKVVFSGLTVQKDKVSIYKDVRVALYNRLIAASNLVN